MIRRTILALAALLLAPSIAFAECCEDADAILFEDDEWIVCEYTYYENNPPRIVTQIEAWQVAHCSPPDNPSPGEETRN